MVTLWSLSAQELSFHLKGSARDEKGRIHVRSLTRSVFGGLFLLVMSKWKQIPQFALLAFLFSFSIHCSFNSPSFSSITLKCKHRTSFVAQWIRISACQYREHGFNPWLGNQNPTCHGTTKPAHHSYRALALWSPHAATREHPEHCRERSHLPQLKTQHSQIN